MKFIYEIDRTFPLSVADWLPYAYIKALKFYKSLKIFKSDKYLKS